MKRNSWHAKFFLYVTEKELPKTKVKYYLFWALIIVFGSCSIFIMALYCYGWYYIIIHGTFNTGTKSLLLDVTAFIWVMINVYAVIISIVALISLGGRNEIPRSSSIVRKLNERYNKITWKD